MEGEVCQGLQSGVPHCRIQTQARLSSTASRPLPNVRSSTRMASGYTSSALRLQRGACGLGLTFAPSSYGLVTPTWNQQRYLKPSRSLAVREKVNEIVA